MTEKTLSAAMALAFAEIEGAAKSAAGQVGQQKYKYADLTAVIDAIKPALIKHGLFFTQQPRASEAGITVETFLHHAGGESMALGALFVPANQHNAQGFGSALTYARRYALVTAFGVPTEDDDGNAASKQQPEKQSAFITDAQRTELLGMLESMNVQVGAFLQKGNITDLRELAAGLFDIAKKWIYQQAAKGKTRPGDDLGDEIPF